MSRDIVWNVQSMCEEAKASLTQKRWVGGIPLLCLSPLWERFPPTLWPQLARASLRQDFLSGSRYARNVLFRDSIGSLSTNHPCRHISAFKIQHIIDCSLQQRKPSGFHRLKAKLCQVTKYWICIDMWMWAFIC